MDRDERRERLTAYQPGYLDAMTLWLGYVLPTVLVVWALLQLVLWRGFWLGSGGRITYLCTSRDWMIVIGFSAAAVGGAATLFVYRVLIARYHRPSLVWLSLSLSLLIASLALGCGRSFFLTEDQYSKWMLG
jgi:hypothetical protein